MSVTTCAVTHFARLIDVLSPQAGVLVMFEGYFDESGSFEEEPNIFCISGYFMPTDAARQMDAEWRKVLGEHGLPFFHMVDCAHGSPPYYSKMTKEERIEIQSKLIGLIKKHTVIGFSALTYAESFTETPNTPDEYTACADMCVTSLYSFLDMNRTKGGEIAYFFENGHSKKNSAYGHLPEKLKRYSASMTFADKDKVPLLQAADILAWQSAKYVKDRMSGKRAPRKDFMSLMEHRHSLMYLNIENGEPSLAIEDFPLSVRSQHTAIMSMKADGPLRYFEVEGTDGVGQIPIIPVKGVPGWAIGPGKMALVQFKDFADRTFYIGFDEQRLHESILAIISATETYAGSETRPIIKAIDISAGQLGDNVIFKLQVAPTASVYFRTTKEIAKKLGQTLSEIEF